MEFSRQDYWSGLPFPSPGDLSDPGIETWVSCIAGRFFTIWVTREAQDSSMVPNAFAFQHELFAPGRSHRVVCFRPGSHTGSCLLPYKMVPLKVHILLDHDRMSGSSAGTAGSVSYPQPAPCLHVRSCPASPALSPSPPANLFSSAQCPSSWAVLLAPGVHSAVAGLTHDQNCSYSHLKFYLLGLYLQLFLLAFSCPRDWISSFCCKFTSKWVLLLWWKREQEGKVVATGEPSHHSPGGLKTCVSAQRSFCPQELEPQERS